MLIGLRIIVLALLAGATLAVGATAATAFPAMKALDPTLSTFAAWPDPHWPIAAGDVANRLFRMLDVMSAVCVGLAAASMLPRSARPGRTASGIVSIIAVAGLIAIVATTWAWLRPTMHGHLETYWTAARAGDVERGRAARDAFTLLHPTSSRLLTAQLILALIGAACTRPAAPAVAQ